MAKWAVKPQGASIRQACADFMISETCYRYRPKLSDENAVIADWLGRLTYNQKNWGFGLCFLHLRNVKGFGWNHKRVYRIYRELELNLRIKPKKRIVREKPQPLAVPDAINQVWSMDFMHDQLSDGRSFRLFNVLTNHRGRCSWPAACRAPRRRGIRRRPPEVYCGAKSFNFVGASREINGSSPPGGTPSVCWIVPSACR
jgi:putative transposase